MAKQKIRYVKARALNPSFDPRENNPRIDAPEANIPGLPGKYRGRYFDTGRGQMIDFGYDDRVIGSGGREAYLLPDGRWLSGKRRESYGNLLERKFSNNPPRWVVAQLRTGRASNPTMVTHYQVAWEGEDGEIVTAEELLLANIDDEEVLAALGMLGPGDSAMFGGGATPSCEITALAGPEAPASCCTACSMGRACGSVEDNPSAPSAAMSRIAMRIARGGR